MWSAQTLQLIAAACEEDLGQAGDITSALLPATEEVAVGRVVLREAGVVCGLALGPAICAGFARRLGITCEFAAAPGPQRLWADGNEVAAGTCVATLSGPRATVLTIERTLRTPEPLRGGDADEPVRGRRPPSQSAGADSGYAQDAARLA
jgi:nicotinate-nucleotide pyrophosphorylase (carboxylating)